MVIKFRLYHWLIAIVVYFLIYNFTNHKFKNNQNENDLYNKIANFGLFLSLIFIISLTFFPINTDNYFSDFYVTSIVPFKITIKMLKYTKLSYTLYEIIGNVILFIPYGFFVYIKYKNTQKTVLIVFLTTLFIEFSQAFVVYRSSDIDDVIYNTIGGIIGIYIANYLKKSILNNT